MIKQIKKVGVIGAGTMGAGIAGQVANAGIEVWLLDLPSDGENVNSLSAKGLERLKDPDMPGLMSIEAEKLIRLGNTRDDFHQLEDCDWVAEAVVERLDIKQALYRQLNDVCKGTTIITSNTSTIPISLLTKGMPKKFCERFAITHFFNPVRFMRLLELVRGNLLEMMLLIHLICLVKQCLEKVSFHALILQAFLPIEWVFLLSNARFIRPLNINCRLQKQMLFLAGR